MMKLTTLFSHLHLRSRVFLILLLLAVFAVNASAQTPQILPDKQQGAEYSAPMTLDGRHLFTVRGVSSFPATQRAELIRKRVVDVAKDKSFTLADIAVRDVADRSNIYAGEFLIMSVLDVDAEFEGIDRQLVANIYRENIARAIKNYRHDRSPAVLIQNSIYAAGVTLAAVLLFWAGLRLFRWLDRWSVRHVQGHVKQLADKSHQLIHAGQVWNLIAALLRGIRLLFFLLLIYSLLNTVLGLYPWTRPAAQILFDLILNPLESLWSGFLSSVPNLVFLVILFLVIRYLLKLTRAFFNGIRFGRIKLQDFDPDWAIPTFKIIRVLIVAFAIVIAYPYIPGSQSLAFKGVSLFLGVILSLGSSSFVANIMAGLSMTYRGAFKSGDMVKIGDVVGEIEEIKLMITRVSTPKNESVVIPNSNILSTNVINYSVMARKQGLVLHTTVGIGYDTPWRQVEAMLLIAADRTEGFCREPKPFVLQQSLEDFAINYELNAYIKDEKKMLTLRSDLLKSIQDVFNEHGVQIMSPAYESDPETPKLVPPEQWYTAPAVKPET